MRHKNQTKGFASLSRRNPLTLAARKLLARSRGVPVEEMARPLKPPAKPVKA